MKKIGLESLVRRYKNYRGIYITKEAHILELEGCFYQPMLSGLNPVTQRQQTRLRRLITWALG